MTCTILLSKLTSDYNFSPTSSDPQQAQEIHVQLCSPDQLQPKPEVSQLKFGTVFTDHMLQIEFSEQVGGWQAPSISPLKYLTLHPAAKVLHYAVEVRRWRNYYWLGSRVGWKKLP